MTPLELPRVINAAGHLSMLGGGVTPEPLAASIASAIEDALIRPVDMAWLKGEASRRIAAATGADAGAVTTGAAAGIALSVAACVVGDNAEMVRALPFAAPRKVVLQAGHDIDFGAPVTQMVAMGGGVPFLAGSPQSISANDLEQAIQGAAAFVFVQSHHVRAPRRLPLDVCIAIAREAGVPVIVDAAAEEDLRAYIAAGSDLVIYSGGKALGGLSSSGFVAGTGPLVAAVRAQERGIGRAMKAGPEQLLSVCIALDAYRGASHDDEPILESLQEGLSGVESLRTAIVPDEAGRPIRRLEVRHADAASVVDALRRNNPPIYVRAHHAAEGRFSIDPRNLTPAAALEVAAALRAICGAG